MIDFFKNKHQKSIVLFFLSLVSSVAVAQWDNNDGIPGSTVNKISRWGNVGIGYSSNFNILPFYPLHIMTGSNTGIKIVNLNGEVDNNIGIDFSTYATGVSNPGHRNARIAAIDMGGYNGSLAFYTKNESGSSENVVERMRISETGNIGIGITTPSRLLHLKGTGASIFLDGSGQYGTYSFEIGKDGTPAYSLSYSVFPACGSTRFRLGPANTSQRAMYIYNNRIYFSASSTFSYGYSCSSTPIAGLSGDYLFDGQVSSTSLLVSPAVISPYPTIPSGYIFGVKGGSNFDGIIHVNNLQDKVADHALSGITLGNKITSASGIVPHSWIQTEEGRPLALNPIPNTNGGTVNTSYVAIGFVPGTYTVPVNYKLAVKGKIICEELKVKYAGQWSDYVFEDNYKLLKLSEVEKFILDNKHLPDVPSAADIAKDGIEAGQMDATLLRKIEELTLYMIEMNKEIQELKRQNEFLHSKNDELEKTIK
jgi:hypothetical protein